MDVAFKIRVSRKNSAKLRNGEKKFARIDSNLTGLPNGGLIGLNNIE